MGLDVNGTRLLLYAQAHGVSFEKTATIGRQGLFLTPEALARNLSRFGRPCDEARAAELIARNGAYAEPFLELLGASEIHSFDASDYENATDVADFNHPVGPEYRDRFSVVFDGGTLEHIFNFPTALRNCMEMVAPGGHFVGVTPANNFLGHGFYQFSPELYFRVFTPANGFELRSVILFEDIPDAEWFQVVDPDQVKRRVTLVNGQPTYLAVIARNRASIPLLTTPPQQSDYVALWNAGATTGAAGTDRERERGLISRAIHRMHRLAPASLRRAIYRRTRDMRDQSFTNRGFYRRLDDA